MRRQQIEGHYRLIDRYLEEFGLGALLRTRPHGDRMEDGLVTVHTDAGDLFTCTTEKLLASLKDAKERAKVQGQTLALAELQLLGIKCQIEWAKRAKEEAAVFEGNSATSLTSYRKEVDAAMLKLWGINWADACGDTEPLERALLNNDTAREFAEWWGDKYNLTPVEDWDAYR